MALPEERLSGVFSAARAYMEQPGQGGAAMRGIYMEGPFFSPEKRGAQNPEYIIPPDLAMFERLVAASGGGVRVVAVAPELTGGLDFIQRPAKGSTYPWAIPARIIPRPRRPLPGGPTM